jgi:hypothetical protein
MRAVLVVTAALAAIPAIAGAQTVTEQRRLQAYENLRQLEQSQRIGAVERQLDNLEIRRQSDEALRALQTPRTRAEPVYIPPAIPVTATPAPQEQRQRIDAAEQRLTNLEVRRQSDEALQGLQTPRRARSTDAPYVVAGSSAATGVPALQPRRAPDVSVLAPYPAADAATPGAVATEDGLRDAELAAANARLREIAQAQRGG